MKEIEPLEAASSLIFSDNEREWDLIADLIRQGCEDVQFRFVIFRMIDPDTGPFREMKLEVIRKGKRGRPKKNPDPLESDVIVHDAIRKLVTQDKIEGLRQIATTIKFGTGDQVFRENVADMFDVSSPGPLGLKFKLKRFTQGQPRRRKKRDVQNFLWMQVCVLDQKNVLVFEEAARRFNIDVDTAEQYLKGWKKKQDREFIDFERAVAQQRRDEGDLDYQPFIESNK